MVFQSLKGISFVLVLAAAQMGFAGWNSINSAYSSQPSVSVLASRGQSTVIEVVLPGFQAESLLINGSEFQQISAPGMVPMNIKGQADLPQLSFNVMVPFGADSTVRVLEMDSMDYQVGAIAPSKGALTRDVNPTDVPFEFGPSYFAQQASRNVLSSAQTFTMRDVHGLNVTLTPFSYNHSTKTLSVVSRIKLEVMQPGRSLGMFRINKSLNTEFNSLYESHFVNYSNVSSQSRDLQHIVKDTGTLLIITPQQFENNLKSFVAWKKRRGFDVKMITLESLSAKTYTAIKDAVVADYNARGLSYLILIGDSELMPFHPGKSGNAYRMEADPMYGLITGNDNYPELFVSRMSVKTPAELDVMVSKAVNYESSPDTVNGAWYSQGLGIASDQAGNSDLIDFQRMDLLNEMMLKWHFTNIDKSYDPTANLSQVVRSVNKGVSWINYIGHGSETMWGTTGFSNSNVDQLTNVGMLPIVVSVACVNGHFAYSKDSFAERWTKAGTVDKPTGAVSMFASSTNQAWVEPTVGQKAIVELMTQEKMNTTGALFTHGSVAILESNMSQAAQTFETWHNFGDATLQIRTKVPTAIQIQNSAWTDATTMGVNATEAGITVVAMKGEEVAAKAVTDATGQAQLVFAAAPEAGEITEMVLTGFNKIPLRMPVTR